MEVLKKGDKNGNGMIFRVQSRSGVDIYGLATPNKYGGNWDLGPTWNYLVMTEHPFLVDTGRTGTSRELVEMMAYTGLPIRDLKSVVLSHGHEDHDGGLPEMIRKSGAAALAHPIYEMLIRLEPEKVPEGISQSFPPSCWHCPMPESFVNDNCHEYHLNRHALEVHNIFEAGSRLGQDISIKYLPGHSPDAIAIVIDDIAIVGDNAMPHISPAPSRRASYDLLEPVFRGDSSAIREAFGLTAYIRTLKSLLEMAENIPDIQALPGHRLYYNDCWNWFSLAERSAEIITHHIERCNDIVRILGSSLKTAREIMEAHFEPSLLEGMGSQLANNEVMSHLELLQECGDVSSRGEHYTASGTESFSSYIGELSPWR